MGDVLLPELLIYDEAFVPCQVAEGDELFRNGIFVFNISKLLNYLDGDSSGIAVTEVEVDNYPRGFSSINESRVNTVSLDQPVIVAEISPGRYNLIDGNH